MTYGPAKVKIRQFPAAKCSASVEICLHPWKVNSWRMNNNNATTKDWKKIDFSMIFTENWSVVRQIHDLKEEWRNCVRSNVIIEFYRFDFDKKKTLLKCANTSQSHYRNENVIENEPLQLNKHKRLLRQTASTTTIRIEIYLSKRLSPALYIHLLIYAMCWTSINPLS